VRQVGYLPELYEDARSEKYIYKKKFLPQVCCSFTQSVQRSLPSNRKDFCHRFFPLQRK